MTSKGNFRVFDDGVWSTIFEPTEEPEYDPDDVKLKPNDPVNHPSHYTQGNIEVIDYIEDKNMGYNLGNAIKYISRCEHKGNKIQDLEKAIWYIEREIYRSLTEEKE